MLVAFRGTTKSTCVVASSPTALRGFISVSPPFRVSRGLLEERDARMKPVLGRIPNLLLDLLCFGFKSCTASVARVAYRWRFRLHK